MPSRLAATPLKRKYALIAGVAAVGCLWAWRAGVPPVWVFSVHSSITRAMDKQGIPGLSVSVATGGRVRWSAAYGLADVENHVPARVDTVYRMASISKPITAVAVMQLYERGKIDLDADVRDYAPQFPTKLWKVTPRQLLGHLGGVRHYRRDELSSVHRYERLSDGLVIFRDDPLVCEPGTRHIYSTYGYNLLGAAVEGAAKQPYVDYVTTNIFRPAGMLHCGLAEHDAIVPHRARGYARGPDGKLRNSRPTDLSGKIPGAGWCGTVEDLARFALAVQSGKLVKPETLRLMSTRQKTKDGRAVGYGLGWSLSQHDGHQEVCHLGNQQQVSNLLYMQPDRGFAVVLMTNLEHAHLLDLAREIADAVGP